MQDRAALLDALFNGATAFLNTLGEAGLELSRTENGRFRWRWHTLDIESVQTYPHLGEALEDALWFLTQPGAYETRVIGDG